MMAFESASAIPTGISMNGAFFDAVEANM
jgi:hypothetical protein